MTIGRARDDFVESRDAALEGVGVPATWTLPTLVLLETWAKEENEHRVDLAAQLGPYQPVVGIPPPPDDALPETVDGWVEYCGACLADLPIEPPYFLGGWSFGGVAALELARRLRGQGVPVAFVIMIDSWRPKRNPKGVRKYLEYHAGQMLELPREARRSYAAERVRRGAKRQMNRLMWETVARLDFRKRHQAPPEPRHTLIRAIRISYLKYEPTPYDAPVSFYSCPESIARCNGDLSLGWARWLRGGFEQVTISGGHWSLWDATNITQLAEAMQRSLAMARERSVDRARLHEPSATV